MRNTPMVILVSIIVIAIALVGILGMALRAGDKAPAVGSEAPDFTLNSQDGKPVSLHDYKGKWVALEFWGHWCGPCVAGAIPRMMEIYDDHADEATAAEHARLFVLPAAEPVSAPTGR